MYSHTRQFSNARAILLNIFIGTTTRGCNNLLTIRHPVRYTSRHVLKWLVNEDGSALKKRSNLALTIRPLQSAYLKFFEYFRIHLPLPRKD